MTTTAESSPVLVVAAPVFNKSRYLPEAIESLLEQTLTRLALIIVDHASDDETPEIARRYAAEDPRVLVHVNEERLGMLHNTRLAYHLARTTYPDAPYWALGSDHDVWAPRWAELLTHELDSNDEVVLAYPLTNRIDEDGTPIRGSWIFDTKGIVDVRTRFRATYRGMVAGDMIYGVFRVSALDRVGMYESILVPDRLLLSELALQGQFVQVPELLWRRRFHGLADLDRQRKAFFLDGEPWYIALRFPYWLVSTGIVARKYLGSRSRDRVFGLQFTLDYLHASVEHRIWRRKNRFVKQYQRKRKKIRRRFKHARGRRVAAAVYRRFLRRWRKAGHARHQ